MLKYLAVVDKSGVARKLTLKKYSSGVLPKLRYVPVSIVLDGASVVGRVTANNSWTGSNSKALEYIGVEVAGDAVYVTLNYAEKAADFAGLSFVVVEGEGDPVPKRVTVGKKATEREAGRVAEFRKTWAAKSKGEVAEPTEEVAETEKVEA
jgi:hypothetical protein